ncbi:hypothetical protein HUG15_04985 [Salicibibacter cibarius]|uniref:Uncharacterized protein n=1 Tax=Salicibibacter cibarius TaxID=2743000 RepID=A0A7T7CAM8_9BACI|nr:hypothetical protein [Salicibibacter cibarius]QQK75018.1 hypothetical protein HUG15_04985 [Salicibibacter cibarius]
MNTSEKLDEFAAKINTSLEHIVDFTRCYHVVLKPEGYYELMFSDEQFTLSEKNFIKLLDGDWESRKGIYDGAAKVEGKLGHALKLRQIVKTYNE